MTEDEKRVYELLSRSLPSQLDDLCVRLNLPTQELPPTAEDPGTRKAAIWERVKSKEGPKLAILEELLLEQTRTPIPENRAFVSIAKSDREDPLVDHFCKDLAAAFADYERITVEKVVVRASRHGKERDTKWDPWTARSLQQCRAFIPLYSQTYFSDHHQCGKEWALFQSRERASLSRQLTGEHPGSFIFPIFWTWPHETRPRVIRDVQQNLIDFGPSYADEGLRYIVKYAKAERTPHEKLYREILQHLVDRIHGQFTKYGLAELEAVPPLSEVQSAFPNVYPRNLQEDTSGPDEAHFVIVAATQDEISRLRSATAYHKEYRSYWQPYHPQEKEPAVMITQRMAGEQRLLHREIPCDEGLIKALEKAEEGRNRVVLVVDPWTVDLEPYQGYMRDYDRREFLNCMVLVPWNDDDEELRRDPDRRAGLEQSLSDALWNKISARELNKYNDDIRSMRDLQEAIRNALVIIRDRIRARVAIRRVATGAGPGSLPVIGHAPLRQVQGGQAGVQTRRAVGDARHGFPTIKGSNGT